MLKGSACQQWDDCCCFMEPQQPGNPPWLTHITDSLTHVLITWSRDPVFTTDSQWEPSINPDLWPQSQNDNISMCIDAWQQTVSHLKAIVSWQLWVGKQLIAIQGIELFIPLPPTHSHDQSACLKEFNFSCQQPIHLTIAHHVITTIYMLTVPLHPNATFQSYK